MATSSPLGMGMLFTKWDRFSDAGSKDLDTWLRNSDRCCAMANKNDDTVKGHILMLFVDGQAKAVLEELEEEKGSAQKYSVCVTKLRSCFEIVASREAKMATFKVRSQQLGETEEEFMLSLVRLYKADNPTINGIQYEAAVKR